MAETPNYVPARHTIIDARSGLVSRPWIAFFQRLAGATINLTTGVIGTLPWSSLPPQAAGTLVGRGASSGTGSPEVITVGDGLQMVGTELSVVPQELEQVLGRWEVLTNGIVDTPEDIYALGDCIMVWVKD